MKMEISKLLKDNEEYFRNIFKNNDLVIYRYVENKTSGFRGLLIFQDGLVAGDMINNSIIRPIVTSKEPCDFNFIKDDVLFACETTVCQTFEDATYALLAGNTLLMMDGYTTILDIDTKGFVSRGVSEPAGEKVLRGPKEGFQEVLMFNLAMIRRRVQNNRLKIETLYLNTSNHQQVALVYIDGKINPLLVKELKKRLHNIEIEDTFDTNTIKEHIKDHPRSIFQTMGMSERVDVVASKLNEGRILVLADGTSNVLWAPFIFVEGFHAPDDYYLNYYYASISRLIRYLGFFIAVLLPAFYVSIISFHQDILPYNILVKLLEERMQVPFPILMEAITLILLFELLKEATLRGPSQMSQTLGVVSAIVFGDAAINANLISSAMLICVAFSSLCSIMNPRFISSILILKIVFLLLGSTFGVFGIVFGLFVLYIYLYSIDSFNQCFMNNIQTTKGIDSIIRIPRFIYAKKH